MNYLLDTTWKRLVISLLVALGIYAAVSAFADSTYTETKKSQIEASAGDTCRTWSYQTTDTGKELICSRWSKQKR